MHDGSYIVRPQGRVVVGGFVKRLVGLTVASEIESDEAVVSLQRGSQLPVPDMQTLGETVEEEDRSSVGVACFDGVEMMAAASINTVCFIFLFI